MTDFAEKRGELLGVAREARERRGRDARQAIGQAVSAVINPVVEKPFGDEVMVPAFGFDNGPAGVASNYPKELNQAPFFNFLAEEALTPINYLTAGAGGMFNKGRQMVNKALPNLDRATENAGSFLSSPVNYIRNFYGPTDMPTTARTFTGAEVPAAPGRIDRMLSNNNQAVANLVERIPRVGKRAASQVRDIQTPQQAYEARVRAQDFMNWGMQGVDRGLFNMVSPESRALYRSTGVNPTTRAVARDAVGGSSRDTAKAIAQAQQNILTNTRVGRQGPVSPTMDLVDRVSYVSETVPFTPNAYRELLSETRAKSGVRQRDLDFFSEHIGNVWKAGDEKFADASSPLINIKTPTSKETGNHAFDFAHKGPVRTLATMFKDGKRPSLSGMLKTMKGKDVKLHPKMGETDEEILKFAKENNGFYITGSLKGTAITEGGVNYVAKVTPNGKVISVISDENNFLENVPGVGKKLEKAMPNRIVSATPPMKYDLTSDNPMQMTSYVEIPAKQEVSSYGQLVEDIANIKPNPTVLRGERMQTAGGAGMLTGVAGRSAQED